MPATNEIVPNRPLGGHELKEIMKKRFSEMLDRDGCFAPHIGYAKVGFELSFKVVMNNPTYPEHNNKAASTTPARNNKDPQLAAVDSIANVVASAGPDTIVDGKKVVESIDSPNLARVQNDLPVTIDRRNMESGEIRQEKVLYDERAMGAAPPNIQEEDTSIKVAASLGVTSAPKPEPSKDGNPNPKPQQGQHRKGL